MHMPRSSSSFVVGIAAIPAPTDFLVSERELQEMQNSPQATPLNLLPDTERYIHFTRSQEYIGLVVYHLQGWL